MSIQEFARRLQSHPESNALFEALNGLTDPAAVLGENSGISSFVPWEPWPDGDPG